MREIHRTIVSALIFSKDGKLLVGKKDPNGGGVYLEYRHLPGGGVDEWETLEEAVIRETMEEVGIDISNEKIVSLPYGNTGTSEKTLKDTGEKVLCHMEFNRFKIDMDQNADDIKITLGDDLVEAKWFTREEIAATERMTGGREFFQQMGYIK